MRRLRYSDDAAAFFDLPVHEESQPKSKGLDISHASNARLLVDGDFTSVP